MKLYLHFPVAALISPPTGDPSPENGLTVLILTVEDDTLIGKLSGLLVSKLKRKLKKLECTESVSFAQDKLKVGSKSYSLSFFTDSSLTKKLDPKSVAKSVVPENDIFVSASEVTKTAPQEIVDTEDDDPEEIKLLNASISETCSLFLQLYKAGSFREILTKSAELLSDKGFKESAAKYVSVFTNAVEISLYCARIELNNKQPSNALKMLSPLLAKAKQFRNNSEKFKAAKVNLYESIGEAHIQLEEYVEALSSFTDCVKLISPKEKQSKQRVNAKRANAAVLVDFAGDGYGEYLSMTGKEGAQYLELVTNQTKPGEPLHSFAVNVLGKVLLKRGQVGQAAHLVLIALIQDSANADLKKHFAELIREHGTLLLPSILDMMKQSGTNAKSGSKFTASGLSFLAQVLKEHGVMSDAFELVKESHKILPTIKNFLNMIHLTTLRMVSITHYSEYTNTMQCLIESDLIKAYPTDIQKAVITLAKAAGVVSKVQPASNETETKLDDSQVALLLAIVRMCFVINPMPQKVSGKSGYGIIPQISDLIVFIDELLKMDEFKELASYRLELKMYKAIKEQIETLKTNADSAAETKTVHVLGDQSGFDLVWCQTDGLVYRPLIVHEFKLEYLDMNTHYGKLAFDDAIRFVQRFHAREQDVEPAKVVLSLGCVQRVVSNLQNGKHAALADAVAECCASYAKIANRLSKDMKFDVSILKIQSMLEADKSIVEALNNSLQKICQDSSFNFLDK